MYERLTVVRQAVEAVYSEPSGLHALAGFVYEAATGANDFLKPHERSYVGTQTRGHITEAAQLYARQTVDDHKMRYILTSRRDGRYDYTVTDMNMGGKVFHYGIGLRQPREEAVAAFIDSPFAGRIVTVILMNDLRSNTLQTP